jgi:hypothetical protein
MEAVIDLEYNLATDAASPVRRHPRLLINRRDMVAVPAFPCHGSKWPTAAKTGSSLYVASQG